MNTKNIQDHLDRALRNVQETIRFLDAKIAGGLALTAFVSGFTVSRPVLILQLEKLSAVGFPGVILWLLLATLTVSLSMAIFSAWKTQMARTSRDVGNKHRTWVLFPLKTDDLGERGLWMELARKTQSLTDKAIIGEYVDQLAINGTILAEKMKWCNRLLYWAMGAGIVAILLGSLTLAIHLGFLGGIA